MAGTGQGLWVLPGAVAFDSLAAAGQTLADVLAGITTPAAAAPPSVSLQVQTAAPVVGAPVSVAVSASAADGRSLQARVTFYGAAPRCVLPITRHKQHSHQVPIALQCRAHAYTYVTGCGLASVSCHNTQSDSACCCTSCALQGV
jgi:hypothetical protein